MSPQLEQLAQRVQRDLDLLSYPKREWLTPRTAHDGSHVYDVLIVGGGQGGLACAFGLLRERVSNLLVVDENPEDRAGPWLRFARMHTLRTPKYLTGPDLGLPSLTTRAWYEAQHGEGRWEALGRLPKEQWAAYLSWYRKTLRIPVRFDTQVGTLQWSARDRAFQVPCRGPEGESLLYARRVVLATGIEGSGAWHVPALIRDALPPERYAHTRWDIDFAALAGKRVAVLGAGASAFDNAATALEYGAREVKLYFRRAQLVDVNAYRWAEFVGFLRHLGDLPDPLKWRFISQILRMGQLPPTDTLERARAHPNFELMPGAGWKALSLQGDDIVIETERGRHEADFVIIGTGFITDLTMRPELRALAPEIARWSDRYTPPEGERHDDLARHPYLGRGFEFTPLHAERAPYLSNLFNFTFGGLLSLGFGGASISGMKYAIPRLVSGVTRSLFVEDAADHYDSLCAFAEREF